MSEKVYYFHSNPSRRRDRRVTVAGIVSGNKVFVGLSVCSRKDQFNKKLGRQIAEGRAYKALSIFKNSDFVKADPNSSRVLSQSGPNGKEQPWYGWPIPEEHQEKAVAYFVQQAAIATNSKPREYKLRAQPTEAKKQKNELTNAS